VTLVLMLAEPVLALRRHAAARRTAALPHEDEDEVA
jgi:hypothetical protein